MEEVRICCVMAKGEGFIVRNLLIALLLFSSLDPYSNMQVSNNASTQTWKHTLKIVKPLGNMEDPEVPHKVTLQSVYKENWCELNSIILKMLQSRVVASKVLFKLSEETWSPCIFLLHKVGGQQQHTASTGKRRNVQGLSWLGKNHISVSTIFLQTE